jgi:hypothetical protein
MKAAKIKLENEKWQKKKWEHGREEITVEKVSWLRTNGEEKEVPLGQESACQEIEP